MSDTCTCARLKVGHTLTESRNWNPDCIEHGEDSAWWHSPEQVAQREADNDSLRKLYALARRRRNGEDIDPQELKEALGR